MTTDYEDIRQEYEQFRSQHGQSRNGHTPPNGEGEEMPRRLYLTSFEEIDAREIEPMRYLVRPHLPAGEATMLFAPPRNFKSFMAMEWALSVALGRPLFNTYEAERGLVIYFDLENRLDRLRERIRASLARDGYTNSDLDGRLLIQDRGGDIPRWMLDLDAIAQLGDVIADMRPALIVVDNFRKALPFNLSENKNEEVNPLLNSLLAACERADTALLLVHHTNKGYEQFSGAGSLESTMRNVIKIRREPESSAAIVSCVNMSNAEDWEAFAVKMGEHGALEMTQASAQTAPQRDQVRQVLLHGAATIAAIAEQTGLSEFTVRTAIGDLRERGIVLEVGVGESAGRGGPRPRKYGLAAD